MFRSFPALPAAILLGALPFSAGAQTVSDTAHPVASCQKVRALAAVRTPNGRRNRVGCVS